MSRATARVMASTRSAIAITCALLFLGCTSAWEDSFTSSGESVPARNPDALVVLREVPWDRLSRTLDEIEQHRIASDVHPDEWNEQQKLEERAKLLRGLQVSSDPRRVTVLGRSSFLTTYPVRPEDGELSDFARRIGATMVVWSSSCVGKTETIRQEPVTTWEHGWWSGRRDGSGRHSRGSYSESSTVYVPIVVQANEYAFVAYYLREE